VIATLALSFAAKYKSGDLNIHEATKIANAAAGIVVGNKGTSTVSVEDLEAVLPK
jgi:bifunctional ADP-heptose synthase (sugar kinase/adenylyltransferase)